MADINNSPVQNFIQFILNINYTQTELINTKFFIKNTFTLSNITFNNSLIIADYPLLLVLNNSDKYEYYINSDILIQNNNIYIDGNKLIINTEISDISNIIQPFNLYQYYLSDSQIYKPSLNRVANIKLINNIQNINNVYFLPLDQYGNNIGSYLYKIQLYNATNIINTLDINLIADTIYNVKLLLYNSNTELIVASNIKLNVNYFYKLQINNITVNVNSISFYQNSYQHGNFFYQDNINSFYIFVDENTNSFDFSNQINHARYYMNSIEAPVTLNNIFNPRNFNMTENTYNIKNNIETVVSTTTNIINSKPIFNVLKIFDSLSLYFGDQLIETLNEDTFNIMYYFYFDDEKRKQINNIIKIRYNNNGWEFNFPLTFWFYNLSNLGIPLIAMPYIDLNFKYKINSLDKILENNLTKTTFSVKPIINIQICLDTILLDTEERLLFGQNRHEYIIERFIICPQTLIFKQNQIINLRYNNLIKDIFWISKPILHPNTTAYQSITYNYDNKYQYYLTTLNLYNQFLIDNIITENNISYLNDFQIIRNNNTEILNINQSSRIKLFKTDPFFMKYNLNFLLFMLDKYTFNNQIYKLKLYLINIHLNQQHITEYSPVKYLNIQSNGIDFVPDYNQTYWNSVIPYTKFLNSPPIGYYCYTYSLFPTDNQPSGHLNFSKFNNIILNVTSDENVLNEQYIMVNIVKEYNIIRIMSGMGALAWK
jgi:hypothetical protein